MDFSHKEKYKNVGKIQFDCKLNGVTIEHNLRHSVQDKKI